MINSKRVLILSNGPVPTPEHTTVEGGGLRCWGLAQGLRANDPQLEITVAYNEHFRQEKFTQTQDGISLATWREGSTDELLAQFDTILVSYCMGGLSVEVTRKIRPDQQLILDCYVPIYVEVSAREAKDMEQEYYAFMADVSRWDEVLKRGDFFLCASSAQKDYYKGVLSAVGRINPATYNDDLILIAPYGIYREPAVQQNRPINAMIGANADKYKKILWFGGIYPWFDLRDLVDAVAKLNKTVPAKLIIVGARNPFNSHPDFTRRYDELVEYIAKPELSELVLMQDWVPFDDRVDWYLDSDIVTVVNRLGEENKLAWRTRLVDFVWADLPIITNGGDPLGEELIANGAAAKFTGISSSEMASDLEALLGDDKRLTQLKNNINKLRPNYYWDTLTRSVAERIANGDRASDLAHVGMYDFNVRPGANISTPVRIYRKMKKIPAYAKKHGIRNTAYAMQGVVYRRVNKYTQKLAPPEPKMVFVSHQLDMSGAPFVLIDMVKEVKQLYPQIKVEFISYPPTHHQNIKVLNQMGVKPRIFMDRDAIPALGDQDVVVLNTVAHSEGLKEEIFSRLESGRLQKLIWYVHEDDPELLFREDERRRIKHLLQEHKMKFLIAAKKMRENYIKHFETEEGIIYETYRLVIDKEFHRVREANDFSDKLSFCLPGTVGDGRKGQLPVFYAFDFFYKHYYEANPSLYRDFEVVFIGLRDDFLSRQLKFHAASLDGRFKHFPHVTHTENLKIVAQSNITICYSIRECLPLFVFEGMLSGHPILRNNCSGIDEQLVEGKNGYELETDNYWHLVETLERVLNKQKTPDDVLVAMSQASYDIGVAQEKHSYIHGIKSEVESLTKLSK